jgi:hypothetical protein
MVRLMLLRAIYHRLFLPTCPTTMVNASGVCTHRIEIKGTASALSSDVYRKPRTSLAGSPQKVYFFEFGLTSSN